MILIQNYEQCCLVFADIMPFMKGIAPIRRTTKYLNSAGLVFKERVKIMTVNFNDTESESNSPHKGAQDFVFWNIPQVQYKNPDVQIVTLRNMTPSPFITCFLEDSSKVYFDVDSQVAAEKIRYFIMLVVTVCEIHLCLFALRIGKDEIHLFLVQ